MGYKVRLYSGDYDEVLDEVFDTEEEATEIALENVSCDSFGAELLEMMGGEEGEINYDGLEYEIIEED